MQKISKAYLYVFLAVMAWASTAAVAKLLLNEMDSLQVIVYNYSFALAAMLLIAFFQGKLKLFRKYSKTDYLRMLGLGVLAGYLYSVFLLSALRLAPAQEILIINYVWPMAVVIFSWIILKEKLRPISIIALLLSFFGIYYTIAQGNIFGIHFTNIKADTFMILGALSFGLFSALCKKYKYEEITSLMVYYAVGLVLALLHIWVTNSGLALVPLKSIFGLAWLGIVTYALGSFFWLKAIAKTDSAKVTNFVFLTPIISLIYIYFLLGEKILISSIIGLAFVIFGILIQSFVKK